VGAGRARPHWSNARTIDHGDRAGSCLADRAIRADTAAGDRADAADNQRGSDQGNQVRADTIYANRIEADQVVGQVHQTKDVKIGDTKGDIKAPEVAASFIYADEIKANSVIAQHVFVRELRRR
jgi:hypothetical protein